MKTTKEKWAYIDRQLCIRIPYYRLRVWWQELWIREDEFHPSLNLDAKAVSIMLERGKPVVEDIFWGLGMVSQRLHKYLSRLSMRRKIAHKRTLI